LGRIKGNPFLYSHFKEKLGSRNGVGARNFLGRNPFRGPTLSLTLILGKVREGPNVKGVIPGEIPFTQFPWGGFWITWGFRLTKREWGFTNFW